MKERLLMVNRKEPLSIRRQCDLVSVSRGSFYYKPLGETEENLHIMRLMDDHYMERPSEGVIRMRDFLFALGIVANHKRIRRLLRLMGIMAIYPKKNLSRLGQAKYIRPYLLRDLKITRPNQVWAIDITDIPMPKGFLYLTAILDVYSRFVVGWGISNSLDASCSLNVTKEAIQRYGKPEIINSDQGSQFTCHEWIELLEKEEIKISMDGKGRAIDNIFIERFWRSVKWDYVYIKVPADGLELYSGLKDYMDYYNTQLCHQGIV
ncbi:MAG: IS3 family transposase [Anaerolineaceae bacterium]|nr:IS3 family transposase [Anaerolineaceae bacterium]